MSTLIVFSNANDDTLQVIDSVYANIGTTTVAQSSDPTNASASIFGQWHITGPGYLTNIAFLEFDTSIIGSAVVVSAILSLRSTTGTPNVGTLEVRAAAWVGNLGDAIPLEAWRTAAQIANDTLVASLLATSFFTFQHNAFNDVAMPAAINRTGSTRLSLTTSEYRLQSPTPAADETRYASPAAADTAGTTDDPKLTIEYNLPQGKPFSLAHPF